MLPILKSNVEWPSTGKAKSSLNLWKNINLEFRIKFLMFLWSLKEFF